MSSYYTLVNLFGEFPNADDHSYWGMALGAFTTVVAAGIVGVFTGVATPSLSLPPPYSSPSSPFSSCHFCTFHVPKGP